VAFRILLRGKRADFLQAMIVIHDPTCEQFGGSDRPEQPARVTKTAEYLRVRHPDWDWRAPGEVDESAVLLAHDPAVLARLAKAEDFDHDTPYHEGIAAHALRAVGGALSAMGLALDGRNVFSLMRPPGHHATRSRAMGFCYLNQVAIAALAARRRGLQRVAVWDFDAHHGNGTEDILAGINGTLFVSVHQSPCYPGTGLASDGNAVNFPVPPRIERHKLLETLHRSWDALLAFDPGLVLISAGFDAYASDPLAQLTLLPEDYAAMGDWVRQAARPTAAVLEGGYSSDLPILVDSFLGAWSSTSAPPS
jgi:acetoin utilization deacetylase AcuC-like enzyme